MKRFLPLDIFRGITICFMIIVNSSGNWSKTFSPLLHAPWHGFTPTDLVFPSFLFAVGTSFAFVKHRWADKTLNDVIGKIIKRTLIIFLLGYLLSWFPFMRWTDAGALEFKPFVDTRIFGVLQRIALGYFFGAIIIFYLNKRQLIYAGFGLLFAYWGIMAAFGDLTLEGNFARTLDLWFLGDSHMYHGEGIAFDPEGILSTIPAVVNVFGGYLVGVYLLESTISYEKLSKILLVAIGLIFLSYCWDFFFPINKKIWTSSYVILTIGLDLALLAVIIYAMEFIKKPMDFTFFEVFGRNPLIIYILSGLIAKVMYFIRVGDKQSLYSAVYQHGFAWMGDYYAALGFAMTLMFICWGVAWYLYKKNIYIKV